MMMAVGQPLHRQGGRSDAPVAKQTLTHTVTHGNGRAGEASVERNDSKRTVSTEQKSQVIS